MELEVIAILVVIVLATTATIGSYVSQAKAIHPQNGTGVANSAAVGAAGHIKPTTFIPLHSIQTHPGKMSQSSGVIHSRQFGKTKPPTITLKHGLGPNDNPFFWIWHKQLSPIPTHYVRCHLGTTTSTHRSYLWHTVN